MNKSIITAGLVAALTLVSPAGLAAHGPAGDGWHTDSARVIEVVPIMKIVRIEEPRTFCEQHEVRGVADRERSPAPVIIGGIVGGVVGNQLGKGRGNDATTIAGALLGAVIGNDIARDGARHADYQVEERCRTVTDVREEEVVDAYRVTYRYHGRDYVTEMDHDPGRHLRVNTLVEPVRHRGGEHQERDYRNHW